MDRQRPEEKRQSQALQKEHHTEGRGPVCCLPLNVREARAQTGLNIFKINVNQNTVQETGMTGLGERLSLDLIVLPQREELTQEVFFSCTSACLQYRWTGTLALAQAQTLLTFRLSHLCSKDRGKNKQMASLWLDIEISSGCVEVLLTNKAFMCVHMCVIVHVCAHVHAYVCVHSCVGALSHSGG